MERSENKDFINIDRIFREKNPGLYRLLPRFVLGYLKRVVHQDEVNHFIREHGHKQNLQFVAAILEYFQTRVIAAGTENIPAAGGCIIASNHPMGALDAMALVDLVGKKRPDLKFIVNDILLQLKNLNGIFSGVNKHGKNSQEALKNLDDLYASGSAVLIFPAGLVSRKRNGVIRDLDWKKSFITKARQHKLPVVPVHIEGRNSSFFYNLARVRERFGIKSNIEMLYLADEMYKQKNKTITVIFGQPIPYSLFEAGYSDKDWAQLVKEHVYSLPGEGHTRQFEPNR